MTSGAASPRVAAIVQARMGSSRHPGKTLETLGEIPVLDWVLARLSQADSLSEIIVATTDLPIDDVIVEAVRDQAVGVVRGSSDDVLDRYRLAASGSDADVIVRVTADCPLIDPLIVDLAVDTLVATESVYVSTSLDGRFPRGFDVEAFNRDALEVAAAEATDPLEREHVTLYIYRRPDRFVCAQVPAPEWARHPELRLTLDEGDDLRLLRRLVADMQATPETSGVDFVDHLLAHPETAAINTHVAHRNVD